ncbi:SDR family NAD(P)-dependent oxidoreductase [Candidatus Laterigemmans baculatus]|uniref:SDR family NAD(P)-dependent oxidoreductase n=1 Tax=Candidatus Laterigemmans baculatus TaxID=2770505 RepID=UPI0013D8F174|nr:SDR family oxidoreductase [Candidatus Laterigemmans baculatus]
MKLSGKTVLVTGAGRGIGKGCALELARDGATVIVNDRPASPDLAGTVEEIRRGGGTVYGVESDVFSRRGCEDLLAVALKLCGRVDALVSNPAFGVRSPFLEYDPHDFERVLQGTLTSGFHMSQLVARHMVERGGGGNLIFISSVQAEMPLAHSVAYGAAKAGLNHLAQTLAVELAEHRINVNTIEPGWTDTPGEHEAFSEEAIAEEGRKLPWGRLGTPADIGRAAVFLASSDADYITGAILPVDGGFRLKHCRALELTQPIEPRLRD